jgi:HTH-type transcriptional regulator, sugar sensing transcriptional regulator
MSIILSTRRREKRLTIADGLCYKAFMESLLPSLAKLGLTTFEARAYLSLLKRGNVTGYELSKESGIPSSKIYSVLKHLVTKELASPLESHPVRYIPRPPEEVIEKFFGEFRQTQSFLKRNLQRLYRRSGGVEVVIKNILGRKEAFRKARELIRSAKHTLYLAVWQEEWRSIRTAAKTTHTRGVKIYAVAYGSVPIDFGEIYRHAPSDPVFRERKERRLVVVSDDNKALFANFSGGGSGKAVWTDDRGLVLLVRDFIIHEIYIVKIQEALPRQIAKAFGPNWEKIRLQEGLAQGDRS